MKKLVLSTIFLFFVFPLSNLNAFDEQSLLKKDMFALTLKTLLALNLEAEEIWYEDIISMVFDKDSEVSNLVVDILPKYRDIDPVRKENIRIVSLACQKVGEMTLKTRWKSKYFKLTISQSTFGDTSKFVFLTKECREYVQLVKKNKGKAIVYWLQLFPRAFKRAEK